MERARARRAAGRSAAASRSAPAEPSLLGLQRLAGNAAAAAYVQRQEDDDEDWADEAAAGDTATEDGAEETDGGTEATDSAGSDRDTDADTEAGAASDDLPSVDEARAALDPAGAIGAMASQGSDGDLGAADLAGDGAVAQAMPLQRDPQPGEPEPTKQASAGDLLKALSQLPEVKAALDRLQALVEKAWDDIVKKTTTPEKAVVFTVAGALAGGAAAGGLSNKDARALLFKSLDGTKLPVPGVDGLSVTPKFGPGGLQGGTVDVDLLKMFPKLRKVPGLD